MRGLTLVMDSRGTARMVNGMRPERRAQHTRCGAERAVCDNAHWAAPNDADAGSRASALSLRAAHGYVGRE